MAHTLRVPEKYWDLNEAAWVFTDDTEAPAQLDHADGEPVSVPELVDAPVD